MGYENLRLNPCKTWSGLEKFRMGLGIQADPMLGTVGLIVV